MRNLFLTHPLLELAAGELGQQSGLITVESSSPAAANREVVIPIEFNVRPFIPDGDYTGDGHVNQADLDLVLVHWGEASAPLPDGWASHVPTDLIDQDELDRVLLNWGAAAEAQVRSIPEPPGVTLALVILLLLGGRQTRKN